MKVVATTRVRCERCSKSHPADIERHGSEILGRVPCPQGERMTRLSTDADVWLALRAKSRANSLPDSPRRPRLLNLLPVTKHCNFHCPVCYNESGPQANPTFLSVEDAIARMQCARQDGARTISLTGGEATMHPEVLTLIRRARTLGLRPFLITNGLRIAREPGFAQAMKRAGLRRVSLQFDTLDPQTHRVIRGNDFVAEKQEAVRRIVAAGLRLGLTSTVTQLNLHEVDAIIAFGLNLTPALNTITFQAVAQTGRFALQTDALVDKEQILAQVLGAKTIAGVSLDDIWPLPHFESWGLRLSADCGVNLVVAMGPGGARPIGEFLDVAALHDRLHRGGARRRWTDRNLVPLKHLLASARHGQRSALMQYLIGAMSGRGRRGLLVIGVGGFCPRGFVDEQRLAGCATHELTENGGVSPCALYMETPRNITSVPPP